MSPMVEGKECVKNSDKFCTLCSECWGEKNGGNDMSKQTKGKRWKRPYRVGNIAQTFSKIRNRIETERDKLKAEVEELRKNQITIGVDVGVSDKYETLAVTKTGDIITEIKNITTIISDNITLKSLNAEMLEALKGVVKSYRATIGEHRAIIIAERVIVKAEGK